MAGSFEKPEVFDRPSVDAVEYAPRGVVHVPTLAVERGISRLAGVLLAWLHFKVRTGSCCIIILLPPVRASSLLRSPRDLGKRPDMCLYNLQRAVPATDPGLGTVSTRRSSPPRSTRQHGFPVQELLAHLQLQAQIHTSSEACSQCTVCSYCSDWGTVMNFSCRRPYVEP